MADVYEFVGKKKVKTKAGKDFYNYYFKRPFTEYEKNNAECTGFAVETEGSSRDFLLIPGDKCELSYAKGFQDKATLSDIKVVKATGK